MNFQYFKVNIRSLVVLSEKQARNPGKAQKRIANSDRQTEGLTNRRKDQYSSRYILRYTNRTLKNLGNIFSKIRQTEGRIGFSITFHHIIVEILSKMEIIKYFST